MLSTFNRFFPLWAILLSVLAYYLPVLFVELKIYIIPLLSLVMFFMGLTLTVDDFKRVLVSPKPVFIGVLAQFFLMPLIAFILSVLLSLSEQLAAGLILVGCCAGGTASNVICYLAKGDVALSITMTMVSTLFGVFMTPLLCLIYIDENINVDHLSMLVSIVRLVLLPVVLGVLLNYFFHRTVKRLEPALPTLSIITIVVLIAIIVALNQQKMAMIGPLVLLAVILHNLLGLSCGYGLARISGLNEKQCRTIAIEVGMQKSGLGGALAVQYFSPVAALPGAIFSIWHNIAGSVLAGYWRSSNLEEIKNEP
jgi:BASS family bile acid:Na+ symporter